MNGGAGGFGRRKFLAGSAGLLVAAYVFKVNPLGA
jgi:hypothetical protein